MPLPSDGTLKAEYIAPLSIPHEYHDLPAPSSSSLFHETPEYCNDNRDDNRNEGNDTSQEDGGFDSYSSPAVTRRSIKSKSNLFGYHFIIIIAAFREISPLTFKKFPLFITERYHANDFTTFQIVRLMKVVEICHTFVNYLYIRL